MIFTNIRRSGRILASQLCFALQKAPLNELADEGQLDSPW
jgi:hypothetical protein